VDSGADMTLMEVDNCYSLGFDLNGCKQIDSTSSGDTKFPTFIRKLKMKIGDHVLSNVPVAFSTKPIKTLVLG
jgi:Aspartyl protease